jgi:hypothetical protein
MSHSPETAIGPEGPRAPEGPRTPEAPRTPEVARPPTRPPARRQDPVPSRATQRSSGPTVTGAALRAVLASSDAARRAVVLREVLGPPVGLQGPLGRPPGSW